MGGLTLGPRDSMRGCDGAPVWPLGMMSVCKLFATGHTSIMVPLGPGVDYGQEVKHKLHLPFPSSPQIQDTHLFSSSQTYTPGVGLGKGT